MKFVQEFTQEQTLKESFSVFDADEDGKLTLDELNFFMENFGKEHNGLRDKKIVADMLESCKEIEKDGFIDIDQLVKRMIDAWQAPH